jgi:hypothetical protein
MPRSAPPSSSGPLRPDRRVLQSPRPAVQNPRAAIPKSNRGSQYPLCRAVPRRLRGGRLAVPRAPQVTNPLVIAVVGEPVALLDKTKKLTERQAPGPADLVELDVILEAGAGRDRVKPGGLPGCPRRHRGRTISRAQRTCRDVITDPAGMNRCAKPTSSSIGRPDEDSEPIPGKPAEIEVAIQVAPERVHDPECPYDPNDPAAVEAFWSNATVRRPGQP